MREDKASVYERERGFYEKKRLSRVDRETQIRRETAEDAYVDRGTASQNATNGIEINALEDDASLLLIVLRGLDKSRCGCWVLGPEYHIQECIYHWLQRFID